MFYCCYYENTDSCPHNGNIRLVGPSGPNTVEGRVEYCSNGVWGTINNYYFDTRDGEVVCRQLGHQKPRELIEKHTGYKFDFMIVRCATIHF